MREDRKDSTRKQDTTQGKRQRGQKYSGPGTLKGGDKTRQGKTKQDRKVQGHAR